MANYTYTKAVHLLKLASEIKESLEGLLSVKDHGNGDVTLTFEPALDAGQVTTLDSILAAHVSTPPSAPVIETLTNQPIGDFREIDYTILPQALHPVRTFTQGELTLVEWYTDDTLATKVLKVEVLYNRDTFGYVVDRITTRTWFNADGSENPLRSIRTKHYDSLKKQAEIKKRRENNVLNLQANVLNYLVITEGGDPLVQLAVGRAFLDALDAEIDRYIKSGSSDLATEVQNNTTDLWLDNIVPGDVISIRDYMLTELAI